MDSTSEQRPPILAVSTGPIWRLPLAEAFAAIRAAGGEAVEILVTQDAATQDAREIERLANQHDLPVAAVHAPLLLLTRRVYTTDPVEKIKRTLELCRDLDVGVIVLHPPYLWQVRYSLWLMHEMREVIGHDRTLITMENMYPLHVGSRRFGFHRYAGLEGLRRFPHVTLDTSHLAVAEEDIVDAYRRLADHVVHVHLSDNRGRGRDSHAALGEGILPIAEFVRELSAEHLRSIALEINPGPSGDGREQLERVIGSSLQVVRDNLPTNPRTSS